MAFGNSADESQLSHNTASEPKPPTDSLVQGNTTSPEFMLPHSPPGCVIEADKKGEAEYREFSQTIQAKDLNRP